MEKAYKTGVCTACSAAGFIAARGLCRACYQRWRKNGSLDYVRQFTEKTCSVEGCNQRVHGQGLCSKHLLRLRRTGTVAEGRRYTLQTKKPENLITQHDLYPIWCEFKRQRSARKVTPAWVGEEDTFWVFVKDVGERPSKRHRLYPTDRTKLLGPDNFEWRAALIDKHPEETDPEYKARVRQASKEIYGKSYYESEIKRKYGITYDQYHAMLDAQQGKCAICGDDTQTLAIDHDHATGKVRELLCPPCNKGLGHFDDDTDRMTKAIAYLRKHKVK